MNCWVAELQLLAVDRQLVVRLELLGCPVGIVWEAGSERGLRGLKSAGTKSHSGIDSQRGLPDTGSSPPQKKL